MRNKKLYQTPLSLSQYKKLYNMIQFNFSITLGFVIPNSSNHCTRQCIFIMYSYVRIMYYFCMRQIFFCHTKCMATVPSHHPKNFTTPHPILQLPYISPPILRWSQKKRCSSVVEQSACHHLLVLR
jgi:hypothetical protein